MRSLLFQLLHLVVLANGTGHFALDGGSGNYPATTCITDPDTTRAHSRVIAAQCCDASLTGDDGCRRYVSSSNNEGCIAGMPPREYTFTQALALCDAEGLVMCDRSCVGTGCSYNNVLVWTSLPCTESPTASPTFAPTGGTTAAPTTATPTTASPSTSPTTRAPSASPTTSAPTSFSHDPLCSDTCPGYNHDDECDDGELPRSTSLPLPPTSCRTGLVARDAAPTRPVRAPGGEPSTFDFCGLGSDCSDCGGRHPPPLPPPPSPLPPGVKCDDSCIDHNDDSCDDGGPSRDPSPARAPEQLPRLRARAPATVAWLMCAPFCGRPRR